MLIPRYFIYFFAEGHSLKPQEVAEPPYPAQIAQVQTNGGNFHDSLLSQQIDGILTYPSWHLEAELLAGEGHYIGFLHSPYPIVGQRRYTETVANF